MSPDAPERLRLTMLFDPRAIAAVGIGAAAGGILRFLLTQFVLTRFGAGSAPFATAFINVSGSFLLGVVIAVAQSRDDLNPLFRPFLGTGVLGGYTTFSTFSFEAVALAGNGMLGWGFVYVLGSVLLGIGGALGGIATARAFLP